MENPIHSFRETNLVVQLIQISQIKSKTAMSLSSRKKKEGIFCTVYFIRREVFKDLSQCIVYIIHFQIIHTFTNKNHKMKLFTTNKSRMLVFSTVYQKKLKHDYLNEKLEIPRGPLKTRNSCFLNLKSRWVQQRIK